MAKGKIIRLLGGFYTIKREDGKIIESRAKGNFRHKDIDPIVGDNVEFREGEGETLAYIEKVLPRSSAMLRPPIANVDQVMVIVPVAEPKYNSELITKMLVHYEKESVPIVILVSKRDLDEEKSVQLAENFRRVGYPTYAVSLIDEGDAEKLRPVLKDKTTALSGVSAAGKSTLTSHFIDGEVKTGDLSKKTMRGKHTTRHSELFEGEDGIYIFDTPGFSSLEPDGIESEDLKEYFPEFRRLLGECKFNNCMHINEPKCAVKAAVADGEIWRERYDSYVKIYEQLREKEKNQW